MGTKPSSMTATEAQLKCSKDVKVACRMCGGTEEDNGNFKHADWCEKIARKIYSRFNATFKGIYNVIELSLDDERAETAKSLVGNTIMETREDCIDLVVNYFSKDSKL